MISQHVKRIRTLVCIILEERSKMNRKILDMAIMAVFCLSLFAAANIQETEEEISIPAFEYSFTTESNESASVTRNEVIRVTASENYATPIYVAEQRRRKIESVQTLQTYEQELPVKVFGLNRWDIVLTDEEVELLARILWLEARGECEEGQEAVVEVVFNRMASDRFPDTLYEVLSQRNPTQFSTWKNRDSARPTEKEYQSIAYVLDGNTSILRDDTIYFSRKPLTRNLDVVIGGHCFCY